MRANRLKTTFVATVVAAILVVVITVCIIFIPSRPCVKIDAVENLTTLQINDVLLATWSQPNGLGDCPMTYRIQLSNETSLIREGSTVLPMFYFLNVSFAPCSSNTIRVHAVTSARFGDDVVGETGAFTHFGSIGPVRNLQVLQENDALTASWDPPRDAELCALSYEVKLNAEARNTSGNAFTFDRVNSKPCEVKTVTVSPLEVGKNLWGKEEKRDHLELGSVEDLRLERGDQNTLLATWIAPNDTQDCVLSYEVTLTFQGEVTAQELTESLYHSFHIEDMKPCSLSNVTVTPIATVGDVAEETVKGSEIHRVHVEELGPVVNLEITQKSDGLLVSWDPPSESEFCTVVSYEIVLQTRDETVQETHFILENQILLGEAQLEPCVTNIVTVTPMAGISDAETVVKGKALDARYFGDVGPVENLAVEQEGDDLVVSWLPPAVSEECPMFYKVSMRYNNNDDDDVKDITDGLRYVFEDVALKPCATSEVVVIPIVRKDLHESEGGEARGRCSGDIGSVTNFELTLNDDGQLIARWNAPVESELCRLSYEMSLQSTEEITSKAFAFEHVVNGADLRPCAVNTVTLTPIADTEAGVKRGLQDNRTYFADVGPVEDLEVRQSEEDLLVEWMRPPQSELCRISYAVTLSYEDVILDQTQTDVEGFTFVRANLQSCVENRVSVIPIGRSQEHEKQGPQVSKGHYADLGSVINFEVSQRSDGLHARWDAPRNSDLCTDVSYEVVLKSEDETIVESHIILEDEVVFEDANLKPCAVNVIEVNPAAKMGDAVVKGGKVTDSHLADIGAVEDLVVVAIQAEDGLAVNWAPPAFTEDCPLTYEVNLLYNGKVVETGITDGLEHAFEEVDLRPCVIVEVSVVPLVDLYERRGEERRQRHVGGIGSVTNFELTVEDGGKLTARWNAPIGSELCEQLSYEIVLESGDCRQIFDEDRLEHVFEEADVRPCVLNTITLTPVAKVEGDRVRGLGNSRMYFTELGPVVNLAVNQRSDGLLASWNPPERSESCIDVSYEVVLKAGDEAVVESRVVVENEYDFEEADLEPCALSLITVTATAKLSDGETTTTGDDVTQVHIADIGPVQKLVLVQEEDGLVVTWEPPTVTENCPLTYEVNVSYNGEVTETEVTDALKYVFEKADFTPCVVTEVSITPLTDLYEKRGEEIRERHVGEIGSVTNFELTLNANNQLTATWNAPIAAELCELSYEISLEASARQMFNGRSFEHVFEEADVRPCVLNTVSLTPVAKVEGGSVRGTEDLRTYFTELGPVVYLALTQQSNGLLATWDPPERSESCIDVSYEVVLKSEDEAVVESRVVVEKEYDFEEADLEPCALSLITVIPKAKLSDRETTTTGDEATQVHIAEALPLDIGPVQNLVLVQEEDSLAVNWEPPTVTENCPLTYEVNLWNNEGVTESTTTNNLEHAFTNADVRPCAISEVSITPVARKESQEIKGEETSERYFGEIGSVSNFELTLNGDNLLTARWNPPIETELCALSYEISLESTEDAAFLDLTIESQLEHTFSEMVVRSCVAYTATITPIAIFEDDLMQGLQVSLVHVEDIGPVEDLEVNQSGEYLSVTWTRPVRSELCQVSYEVTLSSANEVLNRAETDVEAHVFAQTNLQPCTESDVSVIPTGRREELVTQGPQRSAPHFTAVGPVENLTFQGEPFGISWDEPTDSEACDLSYHVRTDLSEETIVVSENFYGLEYLPCHYYTASVTPFVQGDSSGPEAEAHEVLRVVEIGPAQNLRFSEMAFEWDPPVNAGECEVAYELTVTINGESKALVTQERIYEVSSFCSTAAVVVTAFVDDVTSEPIELEVEVPLTSIGEVENLEFRSDRVRWKRPLGLEVCPVVYRVTHTTGSQTIEVTLPESQTYFLVNLKFCSSHTVSVYAFYEQKNIAGTPVTVQQTIALPNDPTAIGRVKDLKFVSEVRAEWLPPDSVDAELCTVVYSITLDRGFDMATVSKEETAFVVPDVPCSNNVLSVFPIVNGVLGQVAEVSSVLSANYSVNVAPELVSYEVGSTSVNTTWRAFGKEISACQITNFTVELTLEEPKTFVMDIVDNDQRIIGVEVVGLIPDTEYTIRTGVHVLRYPMSGPLSEAFHFKTEPFRFEADDSEEPKWNPPRVSDVTNESSSNNDAVADP